MFVTTRTPTSANDHSRLFVTNLYLTPSTKHAALSYWPRPSVLRTQTDYTFDGIYVTR